MHLDLILRVFLGFKSYPVRTQITGWDASFNAITGLNGSGKSNILDAICFVLGITNMSTARNNPSLSIYNHVKHTYYIDACFEPARSHL